MVVAALMVAICVNAQRIRIIDKDGQPVPYVSVMTADAKFIGVTDLDGVIADVLWQPWGQAPGACGIILDFTSRNLPRYDSRHQSSGHL